MTAISSSGGHHGPGDVADSPSGPVPGHFRQEEAPTDTFEWGSIKWTVSPDTVEGARVTVGEVVINPTKGHALHNHPESDEVLHIIDGEGVQTVGDSGEFYVQAGDSVHIPMGVMHSTFNRGWRQMRILAIYAPGGAERALRLLADFRQLPAGDVPRWERAD
jgi:oxalate decarboxylase/phosphoglucose isomerase-like protein (cupin superfamily)